MPPALRLMRKIGEPVVRLERLDLGRTLLRGRRAVEVGVLEILSESRVSRIRESMLTNWEKTSTRWPPSIASLRSSRERLEFAGGGVGVPASIRRR